MHKGDIAVNAASSITPVASEHQIQEAQHLDSMGIIYTRQVS